MVLREVAHPGCRNLNPPVISIIINNRKKEHKPVSGVHILIHLPWLRNWVRFSESSDYSEEMREYTNCGSKKFLSINRPNTVWLNNAYLDLMFMLYLNANLLISIFLKIISQDRFQDDKPRRPSKSMNSTFLVFKGTDRGAIKWSLSFMQWRWINQNSYYF